MKEHWENIYSSKEDNEVSWYQESPITSIQLINKHASSKTHGLIDVGGGNSNLIQSLSNLQYSNLSVLDISLNALNRTSKKLGVLAKNIEWFEKNILNFNQDRKYEVWHDRAVFHFLTTKKDKLIYKKVLSDHTNPGSILILATFSKKGPIKCSGLDITQYDVAGLKDLFQDQFELLEYFMEDHTTPFQTNQNFIYSVWKKKIKAP